MSNNSHSWVSIFLNSEGYDCRDLDKLIEDGEDINATYNGQTALHKSIEKGDIDCVYKLLEKAADVTIQDDDGNTPLHLAVMNNNSDIVRLLLENGAGETLHIKNKDDKTPYKLMDEDDFEWLNVITDYEKKVEAEEREAVMTPEEKQERNKRIANIAKQQAEYKKANKNARARAKTIQELREGIREYTYRVDRAQSEKDREYFQSQLNSWKDQLNAITTSGGKRRKTRKAKKSKKTSKKSKKTRKH